MRKKKVNLRQKFLKINLIGALLALVAFITALHFGQYELAIGIALGTDLIGLGMIYFDIRYGEALTR